MGSHSCRGAGQPAAADEPKLRLIVSFDGQSSSATRALLRSVGAVERIRYRGIPAVAIDLPESQLAALRASGLVTSVETDARLRTFDHEGGVADPELAASWGVAHIGAGAVHAHPNRGAGVTIAIIDTGIDYTHPELDAHYVGGYDFHNGDADPMDDNQHGTHADGTAARRYMGALPPAGAWTRIEVPASLVGVAGTTISGMAYSLYDGTATWDRAGARTETPVLSSIEVTPAAATVEPGASQQFTATGRDQFGGALPVAPAWSVDGDGSIDAAGLYAAGSTPGVFTITASEGSLTGSTVVTVAPRVDVVWFDDGLPAGATSYGTWDWVDAAPTPYSGLLAHRSTIAAGAHQHYFEGASATLDVAVGETLFAWVYLDPANMPGEIMLQWNDGIWDHRAYWGGNLIPWGVDGTNSRRYMGPLPTAGQWVRLEVPAAMVGLEGRTLRGMAFTLYDGGATWDLAGKR